MLVIMYYSSLTLCLACSDCSKKRDQRNDSFDARGIFRKHGKEEWGEYLIPEVHLSQRFKFDESGYYHCCSSIPLPAGARAE
jgi:activating signal cointegrator complex subunit 1